jgi:5-methylcytosine-specific restriction endonuclease McrA
MYSEDKVIILLNKFGGKVYGDYTRNQTMEDFTEEWFEQYKKKQHGV